MDFPADQIEADILQYPHCSCNYITAHLSPAQLSVKVDRSIWSRDAALYVPDSMDFLTCNYSSDVKMIIALMSMRPEIDRVDM